MTNIDEFLNTNLPFIRQLISGEVLSKWPALIKARNEKNFTINGVSDDALSRLVEFITKHNPGKWSFNKNAILPELAVKLIMEKRNVSKEEAIKLVLTNDEMDEAQVNRDMLRGSSQ